MSIATISRLALISAVAGVLGATAPASAQDAIQAPGQKHIGTKSEMIPSLAVLNSDGASLKDGKLAMTGISANTIVFADRPFRSAGHVLTSHFIKQWDEGKDSFAKDPPNATISVLGSDGKSVEDAVVELRAPKLEGGTLTFDVAVLEGELKGADGPASLFVDWFAARGPDGGAVVHGGAWHAPVWHGAWYAHPVPVAVPVPVYHPYPYPPCGYYPYPPCPY
jgi:hypothetical protein